MTEQLISTRELASRLGLSVRTVRALANDGHIPSFRVGNRLRFDWRAVLGALQQGKGPNRAS
jgi:excisionase family DNA binding protein